MCNECQVCGCSQALTKFEVFTLMFKACFCALALMALMLAAAIWCRENVRFGSDVARAAEDGRIAGWNEAVSKEEKLCIQIPDKDVANATKTVGALIELVCS